jgi:tRNA modification GTPase|tara:strand:- start:927 stop:2234 length:1308 start_codon:yes stop_codon:yes gene_type:complete
VIFALATPIAQSALAVFRASGSGCIEVFNSVLDSPVSGFREICLRNIIWEGSLVDRCSVVFYQGPNSFTGEDSVEIFCHGGLPVIKKLASVFLGLGFLEAAPGDFSRRAYENGKVSLNEAEAIADLIHAEDDERARLSSAALSGTLSEMVVGLGEDMDSLRVFVEGSIDFSDEDYDFIQEGRVGFRLDELRKRVLNIIDSSLVSSQRASKKRLLFFGPPNTGKSSLFNRFLGFDRALVSNIPGTTRDLIDSEMFYNSVSLELVDSAGVRDAVGLIESRGVELAWSELEETDVVLVVFDKNTEAFVPDFVSSLKEKRYLLVFNKIDESSPSVAFDCLVSAKTGEGVKGLKDMILPLVKSLPADSEKIFLIRDRHLMLFQDSLEHLENCALKIQQERDVDVAAEDLRLSRACLDGFLGVKAPDDLLGDIFKDFCIGK